MKDDGLFLLGAGSFMLAAMIAALLLIPKVNPLFICYQIISLIIISYIIFTYFDIYVDGCFENRSASKFKDLYVDLFRCALPLLALNLITAVLLEGLRYSAIVITVMASAIAAIVSYIMMSPYLGRKVSIDLPEKNSILKIILIMILGFGLRAYVMGWREIPIGNDAPMYLLQALKGLQMPLSDLVRNGLSVSSNPYGDTWQFSQLWLTMSLMALKKLGLGPEYISKAVIPLISTLSIAGVYLIGKYISSNRLGLNAALVFAILPTEVLFAQLYKEVLGELFLILSMAFFIKVISSKDVSLRKRFLNLNRQNLYAILLLICVAILVKAAVTSFTFFLFFVVSLSIFAVLKSNKITTAAMALIVALGSIGATLALMLLHSPQSGIYPVVSDLSYLVVHGGWRIHPYGYFALPIMILTNIIPSSIALFYIFKVARRDHIWTFEVNALAFSLPLIAVIMMISLVLTSIMGYNLFPTSLFYYSIRLSIYAGIPISIITAAFLMKVAKNNGMAYVLIILVLLINFCICISPGTTIHASMLSTPIDEKSYDLLESIRGPYPVFVAGNFSTDQYGLNGESVGYKNWIEYLVYKNTGMDPIFIDSGSSISCQMGKVIEYKNKSLIEVR